MNAQTWHWAASPQNSGWPWPHSSSTSQSNGLWGDYRAAGVCLLAYAALGWQLRQVERLQESKAALHADIAQLQADVAKLEKEGGRIQLGECNAENGRKRLCVRVSTRQGPQKDYRGPFGQEGGPVM